MKLKFVLITLLLMVHTNAQEVFTDITASGDGDGKPRTTEFTAFIDERGEIRNISTYETNLELDTKDSKPVSNNSTPLTEVQSTSSVTYVNPNTASAVTNGYETTLPTIDNTKTAMESTTNTDYISNCDDCVAFEEIFNTNVKPTTETPPPTTTTEFTTEVPSTVTISGETTIMLPQVPSGKTTFTPTSGGNRCLFMDDNLTCTEDVICYGEGEIDCSEEIETSRTESTFIRKIFLKVSTEESDDEGAGDAIETFPPHLVGVKSEKSLPFLFRTGSLGTTASGIDDSKTTQEKQAISLTTATPIKISTIPLTEERDQKLDTTIANAEIVDLHKKTYNDEQITGSSASIEVSTGVSSSSTHLSNAKSDQEESGESPPVTQVFPLTMRIIQDVTSQSLTTDSVKSSASGNNPPVAEGSSEFTPAIKETVQKITTQMLTVASVDRLSSRLGNNQPVVEGPSEFRRTIKELVQEVTTQILTTDSVDRFSSASGNNPPVAEGPSEFTPTVKETVPEVTTQILTAISVEPLPRAVTEASLEQPLSVRKKREQTAVLGSESTSSGPLPVHMASMESSLKRRVKVCKISGNLVCSPPPTTDICKGKTVCQVVNGTAETPSTNFVEHWTIAVIIIAAIAAILTVFCLCYLVLTSWKKLKVQPQNRVTTLSVTACE